MPSPIAVDTHDYEWKVRVFGVTYPYPNEGAARRFYDAHRHRGAVLLQNDEEVEA